PDSSAVLPYLAMALLYKRSNRLWHFLIRHRLTGLVWRPMVEWTRLRHLRFRRRLEAADQPAAHIAPAVISAGVLLSELIDAALDGRHDGRIAQTGLEAP